MSLLTLLATRPLLAMAPLKLMVGPRLLRPLTTSAPFKGTFEPDYLDSEGIKVPTYPPLNIQIKGYNFDILENFQAWIHKMSENMGVDVNSSWATPSRTLQLTTFQEGGVRPKDSFTVHVYERNVQVDGLRSIDAPILIDLIRRALPEGVQFSMHEHTVEMDEERWIADPFIDQLRTELKGKEEEKDQEQEKRAKVLEVKSARKRETLLKSLQDED